MDSIRSILAAMLVRAATAEELGRIPSAAGAALSGDWVVAVQGDRLLGTGTLDPRGGPVDWGTPRLWISLMLPEAGDGERVTVLTMLASALIDRGRSLHLPRLLLAWDTMDVPGQAVLTGLGFRPGARWPYFPGASGPAAAPLAEEAIEYVMGYRDPTGSVVDLVWDG